NARPESISLGIGWLPTQCAQVKNPLKATLFTGWAKAGTATSKDNTRRLARIQARTIVKRVIGVSSMAQKLGMPFPPLLSWQRPKVTRNAAPRLTNPVVRKPFALTNSKLL